MEQDPSRLERGECAVCGYIYEPMTGDKPRGIAAGTPFNELPAAWRCPSCNTPVTRFRAIAPRQGGFTGLEENVSFGLGVNTLNPQIKNILIFGGLGLGLLLLMSFYFVGQ